MNKYVLGTVCAASVFASCTNEELIKSGDAQQGIDAKQVEVLLSAKYAADSEAESRMVLEGNEYAWVKGDMVGACYVGSLTGSSIVNTISTNYPFSLTEEPTQPVKTADFTTNTTVYEGQYVFYHQYDGNMVSTVNSKFNVVFPSVQSIDPANINKSVAENNLFVSPVIPVEGIKYQEVNTIPVQFVPVYSTLEIKIKNNTDGGKAVKVNKVEVIGDNLLPSGNFDFDTNTAFSVAEKATADKIKVAVENMNKNHNLLENVTGLAKNQTISAVIKGSDLTVNHGETKSIKVLIPSGIYTIGDASLGQSDATKHSVEKFIIYTEEGSYEVSAESTTQEGAKAENIEFTHRKVRNVTAEITGKANTVKSFTINNIDDWNSAVAYAENNNKDVEFVLAADLKVTELPACPIYVTGTKTLELAGENLTLVRDSYFANIKNTGSINLTENVRIANITNYGTVNVATTEDIVGNNSIAFDKATAGIKSLTNRGIINIDGTMTANSTDWKNATKAGSEPAGTINVNKDGKLILGGVWTNDSEINVEGVVNVEAYALVNKGTVNLKTATGKFVGVSYKIDNYGTITLDAIKDIFLDKNFEQIADPMTTAGKGHVEVAVVPSDFDGSKIIPTIEEANALKLTGEWNKTTLKNVKERWNNTFTMITLGDTNIDFGGYTCGDSYDFLKDVSEVNIEGNVEFNNSTVKPVNVYFKKDGTESAILSVKGNLTISKNVKLGTYNADEHVYDAMNISILGKVTNKGMIFGQLSVGEKGYTLGEFINEKDAKTYVVDRLQKEDIVFYIGFTNYGKVVNSGNIFANSFIQNGSLIGNSVELIQ